MAAIRGPRRPRRSLSGPITSCPSASPATQRGQRQLDLRGARVEVGGDLREGRQVHVDRERPDRVDRAEHHDQAHPCGPGARRRALLGVRAHQEGRAALGPRRAGAQAAQPPGGPGAADPLDADEAEPVRGQHADVEHRAARQAPVLEGRAQAERAPRGGEGAPHPLERAGAAPALGRPAAEHDPAAGRDAADREFGHPRPAPGRAHEDRDGRADALEVRARRRRSSRPPGCRPPRPRPAGPPRRRRRSPGSRRPRLRRGRAAATSPPGRRSSRPPRCRAPRRATGLTAGSAVSQSAPSSKPSASLSGRRAISQPTWPSTTSRSAASPPSPQSSGPPRDRARPPCRCRRRAQHVRPVAARERVVARQAQQDVRGGRADERVGERAALDGLHGAEAVAVGVGARGQRRRTPAVRRSS